MLAKNSLRQAMSQITMTCGVTHLYHNTSTQTKRKIMKKKTIVLSVVLVSVLGLSGCGGGSSSNETPTEVSAQTMTGSFIDSAVEGLSYRCSSGNSGVTNRAGEYTCNTKDSVSFSINGFELGSAPIQEIMSPKTLHDDATVVTNIAQLLQTLDSDANPENGITLDATSQEVQALSSHTDVALTQVDFDSVMASYIGKTLVDEAQANAHLDATLQATQVSDKSNVVILKGLTSSVCSTQNYNDNEFEGYTSYDDFISHGGSAVWSFYNTTKSCSDYSAAGACQVQDVSDHIGGSGSCVSIVTFPSGSTDGTGEETELPIEISYERYTTKYKPMMINLTSEYIYFNGGDNYLIEPNYLETTAQEQVASELYNIGGEVRYGYLSYFATKYAFVGTQLIETQINSNDEEYEVHNDTLSKEENAYSYTSYSATKTIKFTRPIHSETLHKMYLDIGLDIAFEEDDIAQYMYVQSAFTSFNAYDVNLVMNASAYLKVKQYFDENYSIY